MTEPRKALIYEWFDVDEQLDHENENGEVGVVCKSERQADEMLAAYKASKDRISEDT